MKILLDASTLLPLITKSGKKLITEAANADMWTTDLAIYESCNALRKLSTLLKTLTSKETQDISETLTEVIEKELIKTTNFTNVNLPYTLDMAQKTSTTFYDALYITTAQSLKATLATEDHKLVKEASKYVKTISFPQLQNELSRKTELT